MSDINSLLTQWHEAKANADKWKVEEMRLRKEIFDQAFPNPQLGTNKIRIEHGMALVGDFKLNYRIDKPLLTSMRNEPDLAPILAEVIDYRPEVKAGAFQKLSVDDKNKIGACITSTAGSPGLEIKDASKMRW